MNKEILVFYQQCLRRAFRGKYGLVEGWTGGLTFLLLIVTKLVSLPPESVPIIQTDLPLYFLIFALILTIILGFVTAPYEIFREEQEKVSRLEDRCRPRFQFSLPSTGLTNIDLRGVTNEATSGHRQTVTTGFLPDVVSITCTNTGERAATGCRARLLSVEHIVDGKSTPLKIVESVDLPWNKIDPEQHLVTSIGPNDAKRIWIAAVRDMGQMWIYRDTKALPLEYQQIFGESGEYRMVIQVDADDLAPVQVHLEVKTEPADRSKATGMIRGTGIPRIIEQASPRV